MERFVHWKSSHMMVLNQFNLCLLIAKMAAPCQSMDKLQLQNLAKVLESYRKAQLNKKTPLLTECHPLWRHETPINSKTRSTLYVHRCSTDLNYKNKQKEIEMEMAYHTSTTSTHQHKQKHLCLREQRQQGSTILFTLCPRPQQDIGSSPH